MRRPSIFNEGKAATVATLGPASSKPDVIEQMIDKGLDVVRLNMSHGTKAEHKTRFEMVRDVDDSIPILFDMSGPKIRIGELAEPVMLTSGDDFCITAKDRIGDVNCVSLTYPELIKLASVGDKLFLNDGLIELKIKEKDGQELKCEVVAGGPLSSRKGLNAPGVPIQLYAPTDKDLSDIESTVELEPDFYSVSFVRRPQDIQTVKDTIYQYTTDSIPIVSKIEHQDALDNIDRITAMSDAIMVARGDLGVELPPEDIPLIQERLVNKCNQIGKPCIVATQMLESMVVSTKPTRAEASDVANAILQGADAVMLSAETATGKYPVHAVDMMEKIIKRVQPKIITRSEPRIQSSGNIPESIGRAAVALATSVNADVIVSFTRSGATSSYVAKYRPKQPIISITPLVKTARRVRLQWGVIPLRMEHDFSDTDFMIHAGIKLAHERDLIDKYNSAVVVAGSLLGLPSTTNLIQYIQVDEIINLDMQKRFEAANSPNMKPKKNAKAKKK